jgi:hypothetical protein
MLNFLNVCVAAQRSNKTAIQVAATLPTSTTFLSRHCDIEHEPIIFGFPLSAVYYFFDSWVPSCSRFLLRLDPSSRIIATPSFRYVAPHLYLTKYLSWIV